MAMSTSEGSEDIICSFLDNLHKQLAKYTIKQIELRSDEMGILIGPKGRNIRWVIERSPDLSVASGFYTLVVVRRITEESLCHDIRVGEDQIVSLGNLIP